HDVAAAEDRFAQTDPEDSATLEDILSSLEHAPRTGSWRFEEPEGLAAILEALPPASPTGAPVGDELADRVLGGWLGRIAGCNLGKPVEQGEHWTTDRLREYLELADAWPLRDYIPVLDPLPAGFEFREN